MFATGFIFGYRIIYKIYLRENKPITDLDPLLMHLVIGTVVGARLGHVLFYDPGYYFAHPLEILQIWKGGLASHGGGIGVLLATYLYCRKRPDQPFLWLIDRLAIPTALAGAFIRIGNFFNSEILGTPTHVPWAVVFYRIDDVPRHPVQLYESISYAIIFAILMTIYKQRADNLRPGLLVGLFLVLVFSARFLLEFVKTHQASYTSTLFSVGQWLSIPMVLAGVVLLAWGGGKSPQK